jgi:peptidoglycan L-alanyl-D-glutamate endopeptidase CwlK
MKSKGEIMHTNPAVNCPTCSEKFQTCDARIIDFVLRVQHVFTDCHVAVAYRDQADQELAFQQGKSKLNYPDSLHNHTVSSKPSSLAVDLFLLDLDGTALFPITYYNQIWDYFQAHREEFFHPIEWGGNWSTFKDWDHYQLILSDDAG